MSEITLTAKDVRLHTLAVLKGAAEGDDTKHLGSLMAMHIHAAPLVKAGLVVETGGEYLTTADGMAFYTEHRLGDLPDGRANYWNADDLIAAEEALRALRTS